MKFCVIGIGRFGHSVATHLADNGMEVLAVDSNESIIASIRDKVTQAVCMRVTDEESLRTIGVEEVDTAIVAMAENISQSILITALLKKRLKVPKVIARSVNEIHKEILELVGADYVIQPEQEMGAKLAYKLSSPFMEMFKVTENFAISHIKAPKQFVDKELKQLRLMEKYHVRCIGIKKEQDVEVIGLDYVIGPDDILIVGGTLKHLEAVARL